ncbi:Molybdenum cofactor sulfurase [Linum grandiflorum]
MYPKYESSEKVDQLRSDEYGHLSPKVCLDYCGFGLFSYLQTLHYWGSSTFSLSEITANLSNHALYGGAEKGTVEHDIKTRIMDYLNIPENEYGLVFTVSRGSAFKLLAESYPFHTNKKLLTMFDYESQSVNWMGQCAKDKGAKVHSAWFKWPTLKPCSTDLRKQISNKKKRKKDAATGLFVFPVQSRVTGAKYSYQWMALAQQNNWHVLLDAGSLGPKDMDSLGLSLFRPDFIITSFYRVFGYDPTGFGCLLIKKSVMSSLQHRSGSTGSGIVKITPEYPLYLSDSVDGLDGLGLNKTTLRLRYLINWLVTSLLQLRLSNPEREGEGEGVHLVHIYGPKIKYERGAAVAFNVRDRNQGLVNPEVVQRLAEKEGISLGIGFLSHIRIVDTPRQHKGGLNLEVVTASLGFLTNFEDVYKLWVFVSKFLNPTFTREGTLPTVEEEGEET